jgi:LmbE family N-acetylglucosaminyl deacetylase
MFKALRHRPKSTSVRSTKSKYSKLITRAVLAALCAVGFVAAILAYRIHTGNAAMSSYRLDPTPSPHKSTSILIFSPHPDDETLGTGGLIQETLKAGGHVHVVFMTNGDAFRVGVSDYYKVLPVKPSDCVAYGKMRQKEALASLSTLGLEPDDVTFLGYPDRGLMRMWENWWLPSNPWTSYYTHASTVVYPNAPSYGKPNSGVSVLADVCNEIVRYHPTDIYTTHPTDDHPDHSASASFVVAAMHSLECDGHPWVTNIRLHFFLIHRGDWPVPQGYIPRMDLAPPAAFLHLDTRWSSLSLPYHSRIIKHNALTHYVSQEEMMGDFLNGFVRSNELFGDLPESRCVARNVPDRTIHLTGAADSWPPSRPVALDPVGDTVVRDFQSGGDIVAIYAAHDSKCLYLRMDMHSVLSKSINYRFMLRPFDSKMRTIPKVIIISFSPRSLASATPLKLPSGATVIWQDNTLEVCQPLSGLGTRKPTLLFVEGKTTFAQVIVDHTGYRTVLIK